MSKQPAFRLYEGDGKTLHDRGGKLPPFEQLPRLHDPTFYRPDEGLKNAVNVALALGQPLLVTGEPGTGKTELAGSIAHELGLGDPLVFHTSTTSTARDLFYRYDMLGHFHASQFREEPPAVDSFISYEALGLAILLAMDPPKANPFLPESFKNKGPRRSVVLIDEIDKAPRDLPNDVLNEIEHLTFTVKETGREFRAEPRYRPIVVLTSNSEQNLPDAFLQRCVFYHVAFPGTKELKEIAKLRLGGDEALPNELLDGAAKHFYKIRDLALKKKPATAEFLAWVKILKKLPLNPNRIEPKEKDALKLTYAVLAKTIEDQAKMEEHLDRPA